jgi:hypothetical protein
MPEPNPFPCGGPGQRACPPVPAAVVNGEDLWTAKQIHQYGADCYQMGIADQKALAQIIDYKKNHGV